MVPITGRASASFSSMLKLKRIRNDAQCVACNIRCVIGRAKRAPHCVQSRFRVIYIRLITRVNVEYDEIFS